MATKTITVRAEIYERVARVAGKIMQEHGVRCSLGRAIELAMTTFEHGYDDNEEFRKKVGRILKGRRE